MPISNDFGKIMGKWFYPNKLEADNLKKIETSSLKKDGYFCGVNSGWITWRYGLSGNESSVGIKVVTLWEDKHLRIEYTKTGNAGEKEDFSYKIPLTTTPCRFGGKRYWFICPMFRGDKYCGKRVGVLYMVGDYFACRHCHDLTYASRNVGGRLKAFGRIISIPEIDAIRAEVKRTHYNGKPTRKFLRYLEKERRFMAVFTAHAQFLENSVQKSKVE